MLKRIKKFKSAILIGVFHRKYTHKAAQDLLYPLPATKIDVEGLMNIRM